MKTMCSLLVAALLASSALAAEAPQAPASPSPRPSSMASPVPQINMPDACKPIEDACTKAGFRPGGMRDGLGLFPHCIKPVLDGKPAKYGRKPLPKVATAVVTKCKDAIKAEMTKYKKEHQ